MYCCELQYVGSFDAGTVQVCTVLYCEKKVVVMRLLNDSRREILKVLVPVRGAALPQHRSSLVPVRYSLSQDMHSCERVGPI